MSQTSIEWCDHSVNPIRARYKGRVGHYCELAGPGCVNCYASALQKRFGMPKFGKKKTELPEGMEVFLDESKLAEVRRRQKPTRYFWEDMSDLFGWWVKPEWIAQCFETMDATPQHTHILLTKRPENIRRMWPAEPVCFTPEQPINDMLNFQGWWAENCWGLSPLGRKNIWLLTSISTQADADKNIPELLACRDLVPVLGVSAEPLLEQLDLSGWVGIEVDRDGSWRQESKWGGLTRVLDWVIVGGESGHKARPCHIEWIDSLVQQCRSAGVACFVKQLGANHRWPTMADASLAELVIKHPKGGNIGEWPMRLRVREFPRLEGL